MLPRDPRFDEKELSPESPSTANCPGALGTDCLPEPPADQPCLSAILVSV